LDRIKEAEKKVTIIDLELMLTLETQKEFHFGNGKIGRWGIDFIEWLADAELQEANSEDICELFWKSIPLVMFKLKLF